MDGRMRNAQIEQKKDLIIACCKNFYLQTKKPITAAESAQIIEAILHNTEELMRLQREIP